MATETSRVRMELTEAQSRVVLRGLAVYRELLDKTSKGEDKAGVPTDATMARIELVDEIARQLKPDETGDLFDQMPEAWRVKDVDGNVIDKKTGEVLDEKQDEKNDDDADDKAA